MVQISDGEIWAARSGLISALQSLFCHPPSFPNLPAKIDIWFFISEEFELISKYATIEYASLRHTTITWPHHFTNAKLRQFISNASLGQSYHLAKFVSWSNSSFGQLRHLVKFIILANASLGQIHHLAKWITRPNPSLDQIRQLIKYTTWQMYHFAKCIIWSSEWPFWQSDVLAKWSVQVSQLWRCDA